MDSINFAERILRVVTNRPSAVSIAGDLYEERSQKGAAWFWLSLTRIVLGRIWRWPLGLYAALFLGMRLFSFYQLAVFGLPFDSPHRASSLWEPLLQTSVFATTVLSFIAIVLAIRYGLRDRMAHLSFLLVIFLSVNMLFWWRPGVLPITLTIFFVVTVLFLRNRESRRAAVAIVSSLAASLAIFLVGGFLGSRLLQWLIPGPYGTKELHDHPAILYLTFSGLVLWVVATAVVSAAMRRWLARGDALNMTPPSNEIYEEPQHTA